MTTTTPTTPETPIYDAVEGELSWNPTMLREPFDLDVAIAQSYRRSLPQPQPHAAGSSRMAPEGRDRSSSKRTRTRTRR